MSEIKRIAINLPDGETDEVNEIAIEILQSRLR